MKTKSRSGKAIIRIALVAVIIASVFTVMFSAAQGVRVSNVMTDKVQTGDDGPGLVTADLNSGLTPTDLVNMLMGEGIVVSNITYSGTNISAGTFSGGTGIIGFESGIILSTGNISSVVGPNTYDDTSTDNGMPGDADLDALIPGYTTYDATVLEFDFVPTSSIVTFEYVFGSEEYNEYVNTSYNDVFGFYINGVNCALIPGTWVITPVSINNVNGGNPYGMNASNPEFYRNNDLDDGGGSINTELDGLTVVLTVTANVNPGETNHIKLAIADAGDFIYDSAVFIKAGSFVAHDLVLTPLSAIGPVGSSHTLTATLTDEDGHGVSGETITFNITDGPHAGLTGTDVTDANGQATWSYTGTTVGTDTIVATGAGETSNNAFMTWESSVFVDVLSVDASEFPKIWAHVHVNTSAGSAGDLTESDFEIYEDGVEQTIESFNVTGGEVTTKADILFVFDDTGSMSDEIDDMKAKCKDLTDAIEAAGIDARYALVSFGDAPELDQDWTADATVFKAAVDALSAYGGGDLPEDNLDAIEMGLGLGFRTDAQKIIIDITDAPTHYKDDGSGFSNYTMPEVENDLISRGVTYIAVSPNETADNEKKVLATNVGGLWIDIHGGDFSTILDQIVGVITSAYHIDYTTTNPAEDCTERTVKVIVHDPVAGEDSDTGKYIAPCEVSGNKVYFIPQSSDASYGSEKEVQLWVNATNFQSGQINLTYSPTCANVTNWERSATFPMGTWTHSVGEEWITFASMSSLTGEYKIGTLTIQCVCEDECSTTLDFVDPSKLFDPAGNEIAGVAWTDGTFECTSGICGDVAPYPGGDGVINMGDVIRLLNHVGNPTEFPVDSWAGDCKCTGTINMGDVILLLNHVGNPEEFPLECC